MVIRTLLLLTRAIVCLHVALKRLNLMLFMFCCLFQAGSLSQCLSFRLWRSSLVKKPHCWSPTSPNLNLWHSGSDWSTEPRSAVSLLCPSLTAKLNSVMDIKNGNFEMRSNITFVYLKIKKVDLSDSGQYFCGFYTNARPILSVIYLKVRGKTIAKFCLSIGTYSSVIFIFITDFENMIFHITIFYEHK